jgi:hypothetical protein
MRTLWLVFYRASSTFEHRTSEGIRMFVVHDAGFRSLWPVIFFLPLVVLSGAYLLAWVLHRRVLHRRSRARLTRPDTKALSIMGLSLLLAAAQLALAAPATEEHEGCPVSTEEARSLGDSLFEQGSYQAAGDCYLAAGDYDRANHAFVKAVGPASAATARQLSDERKQAKMILSKLQLAFRSQH